ncbi:MAG: FecR family protein [Tannerella sp.]|jgi:ferric-dicitrate binding protein FerR (iron transport regulator)|nr:FecR family protein [Tannerella sp.]
MKRIINISDDILIKYCDNQLSEEDKKAVETWVAASPDNRKLIEQMYFTLEVIKRLKVMNNVNTDKAYTRFRLKLRRQKRSLFFPWLSSFQKIAAILFIPLLILTGYLYMQRDGDDKLQQVEVNTNSGVISTFYLPDGSKVWLNTSSSLKYINSTDLNERIVELNGEGYFEVVKNTQKPFVVKVGENYAVEVLGTSFNIAGYADDESIETTLIDGAVKLNMLSENNKTISYNLKPNQKAEYHKEGKAITISNVNSEADIDWTNGAIIFRQEPMDKVLKKLSRHYNVCFDVQDQDIYHALITATFSDEQLPQIMEYLKIASGIEYKILASEIDHGTLKKPIIEIRKKYETEHINSNLMPMK